MNSSELTTREYLVKKGEVDLFVYRKHEEGPVQKPVLFLVHGSSLSALPGYDLKVPGHGSDYSVMDHCAKHGFDVWTMDHEGYGKSSKTARNSNIAMAVEDLEAAMSVVERETGQRNAHFYGQSSGSLRAARFAQTMPQRIRKLVLDAFVWTGVGSPTLAKRREQVDKWRASHVRQIDEAFMHSIFNRDRSGTSEPAVADAVAKAQLAYGDTIPTGTYLDMCANLPVVDPGKILCPVLILRGEHDGIATMDDLLAFFQRLPNMDKHLSVLAGSAHIAPFGLNYRRFYHIVFAFLDVPERVDV